jgi:hypothetical protein
LIDEVLVYSLLKEQRFAEAFELYCPPADRQRLPRCYGSHADLPRGPELEFVDRRFIISQSGPGDEIQAFSLLPSIADRSNHVTATCDPRLRSLLERSFPEQEFLPVARKGGRPQVGFGNRSAADRSRDDLADLMTATARLQAERADAVTLLRDVHRVAARSGASPRVAAYLRPRRDLAAAMRGLIGAARPAIGFVWRSEYRSIPRSIHYLDIEELRPLLDHNATFVCLQHDVTEAERAVCQSMRGRVIFPDSINLRDDFESTAALIKELDLVVGVGTTPVELSGALGVPTLLLAPTHFGTWRDATGDGTDYWYASTRIAGITDYRDRRRCIDEAVSAVRALVP